MSISIILSVGYFIVLLVKKKKRDFEIFKDHTHSSLLFSFWNTPIWAQTHVPLARRHTYKKSVCPNGSDYFWAHHYL